MRFIHKISSLHCKTLGMLQRVLKGVKALWEDNIMGQYLKRNINLNLLSYSLAFVIFIYNFHIFLLSGEY